MISFRVGLGIAPEHLSLTTKRSWANRDKSRVTTYAHQISTDGSATNVDSEYGVSNPTAVVQLEMTKLTRSETTNGGLESDKGADCGVAPTTDLRKEVLTWESMGCSPCLGVRRAQSQSSIGATVQRLSGVQLICVILWHWRKSLGSRGNQMQIYHALANPRRSVPSRTGRQTRMLDATLTLKAS